MCAMCIVSAGLGPIIILILLSLLCLMMWVTLSPDSYGVLQIMLTTHITYLYLALAFALAYVPSITYSYYISNYHPSHTQQLITYSNAADHEHARAQSARSSNTSANGVIRRRNQVHIQHPCIYTACVCCSSTCIHCHCMVMCHVQARNVDGSIVELATQRPPITVHGNQEV